MFDPKQLAFLTAYRRLYSQREAAASAGCTLDDVRRWSQTSPEFSRALQTAQADVRDVSGTQAAVRRFLA